jgi:SAM-dependent methyltransferase
MGILGGTIGLRLLRIIAPDSPQRDCLEAEADDGKIEAAFGGRLEAALAGKTVIDFGCGDGQQAIAMARAVPDCRVIGLDIQQKHLDRARQRAVQAGLEDRCTFAMDTEQRADLIVSFDAFEHFSDPLAILNIMSKLLKPNGEVLVSFGPTWLHPYGGHLFSVFPWAHLIFTERALIRWRARFRDDGAQRFGEVEGGLNQIRIAQFERLVAASPLSIDWLETVPIRGLGILRHRYLREFGSSLVRCRLVLSPLASSPKKQNDSENN